LSNLKPREKGLGDKAYIGHPRFFASFKPAKSAAQHYNIIHMYNNKYRQNIERINRKLKIWHALKYCWRHVRKAPCYTMLHNKHFPCRVSTLKINLNIFEKFDLVSSLSVFVQFSCETFV